MSGGLPLILIALRFFIAKHVIPLGLRKVKVACLNTTTHEYFVAFTLAELAKLRHFVFPPVA
jgi:hypothetical protein